MCLVYSKAESSGFSCLVGLLGNRYTVQYTAEEVYGTLDPMLCNDAS